MLQIFNTQAITRNQRFWRAVVMGFITMIACALAYSFVVRLIHIEFSLFHILIGYGVGYSISTFGRGVQPRFSVLGAVYTTLAIVLADLFVYFGYSVLLYPSLYVFVFTTYIRSLLSMSLNSLLGLLFRLYGIYVGYTTSRIV